MNCPVCGTKIKPWDWRQNCKKCGTNLFLHDFKKRLEAESEEAEKDFLWWTNMTNQFMNYGVKDKVSLTRLLASVLPLLLLCLPALSFDGKGMMYINFLLDSFGGGTLFPDGFGIGDMSAYPGLLPAFILIILSLFMAVLGFFSVVVGPAFMNFKAAFIFEAIGAVCACVGTYLLNFKFIPASGAINPTIFPSFGLYVYCGIMIAESVFFLWFIRYSKKFPSLQSN